MKLFLIYLNDDLFAYSYNDDAVVTLLRVTEGQLALRVETVTTDNIPLKKEIIKSKEHIENLVTWYRINGYQWYKWKYVQYNRNLIPHFSLSFMEKFHNTMKKVELQTLSEALDNLLNKD